MKHSAEELNSTIKHIADQLIYLCKSIVRLEKANSRQNQEIETKLYKREFESIFEAQENRIISYVNPFIERYNEKLDKVAKGNIKWIYVDI